MEPFIAAIGGLPLSGKTTLGSKLSRLTLAHYVDIDDGPARCALHMTDEPYSTEEKSRVERERMDILYSVLHATVHAHIAARRSLIVSAVYREKRRRDGLLEAIGNGVNFEFLLCRINDTREEIERRLDLRRKWGFNGGCRSYEQYVKLLPSWTRPDFPHHVIDTTRGTEQAAQQALHVLQSR